MKIGEMLRAGDWYAALVTLDAAAARAVVEKVRGRDVPRSFRYAQAHESDPPRHQSAWNCMYLDLEPAPDGGERGLLMEVLAYPRYRTAGGGPEVVVQSLDYAPSTCQKSQRCPEYNPDRDCTCGDFDDDEGCQSCYAETCECDYCNSDGWFCATHRTTHP